MNASQRAWSAPLVAAIAACAHATPQAPPPSPCAITDCRPAKAMILQEGNGQYILQAPETPYVNNGVVLVQPRDDFFITGEDRDGALVNLRHIPAPAEGTPNVIHVTFKQEQLNNGAFIMSMRLYSTFARPLVYHAAGVHPRRPLEPFATSTCPLRPGIWMNETWPHPIERLFLRDFRAAADPAACKVY